MCAQVSDTSGPARLSRSAGILLVIGGVLLVLAIMAVGTYNSLVGLQEKMRASWSQVETVLQRRYDLIPNLVNTVKGYASHEKEVLEQVTKYRSQWGEAKTVGEKAQAASALEGTLSRLLLVAENYPDLKADKGFRDLQFELSGTENRIAVERQRYNDSVRAYNERVRKFPAAMIAPMFGFHPSTDYFDAADKAKDTPVVDFSDDRSAGKKNE